MRYISFFILFAIVTLGYSIGKSSNSRPFENFADVEMNDNNSSLLDSLSDSATVATNAYCDCMKKLKNADVCRPSFDKARVAINTLRDSTKAMFNIENEFVRSDNKYIRKVQNLRGQIASCQLHDEDMIYTSPPSER